MQTLDAAVSVGLGPPRTGKTSRYLVIPGIRDQRIIPLRLEQPWQRSSVEYLIQSEQTTGVEAAIIAYVSMLSLLTIGL